MLLKLLNKLRNFRLFGLLKFEDMSTISAYTFLAVWAITQEITPLLQLCTTFVPVLIGLFYLAGRAFAQREDEFYSILDRMLKNSKNAREAHEQYLESARRYRNAIGVYLRDTAAHIESGQPMTADDIATMRAIANNLIREKEAQETKEKPDDQPERGSATSDAGAPGSEGLPPQT